MAVTTTGGVLVKGNNGHINRGGEFEKRAAFVPTYSLPTGTVGVAAGKTGIFVFGSAAAPIVPSGVTYQRLQHPDGVTALTKVVSTDLYAGKIYAVGEFADGGVYHYYDGAQVTDWYDGRARATLSITGGALTAAKAASASFEVTGGTNNIANQITNITINGVVIFNGTAITHTGDNATTAAAIASAINAFTSSPDYTAVATGQLVTVTAVTTGTAINGQSIIRTVTGNFTTTGTAVMAGGAVAVASSLSALYVDGVAIINAPVAWATTANAMASAIASAVNAYTSSPDYTAVASGVNVSIVASVAGAAANGRVITATTSDGLTFSSSTVTMANGSDATVTYQPGNFVKTIDQKVYSLSGPNFHFSGIKAPTKWTTSTTGAGFIDMSSESSGSEDLQAIARYQNLVAIFAARIINIWYTDPDPTLNRKSQVMQNTGTISPRSVTQFGDSDLFYLDESGLRSLKARDASNAAATTDIGVPVDTLIVSKLSTIPLSERRNIFGLIEPSAGRFWLCMKDVIFVFSFFNGAKVSAWTTYTPSYDNSGVTTPFTIEDVAVYNRRVYVRSGDQIYVYGGLGDTPQYDTSVAEAWLPYLDANDPTREKVWQGLDAALEGTWSVAAAMNPNNETNEDTISTLTETTYSVDEIPAIGRSPHISLRFRTKRAEYARLSSVIVHYEPDANADK